MDDFTSTAMKTDIPIATLSASDSGTNEEMAAFPWVQIVLQLIVSIVILIGNGLVIAAVLRYEFLQTPTNVFVVGIAGLDLIMGLIWMFKIGQLVYVYEGYYTCMVRLGIGVLQAVVTGNFLAGTMTLSHTAVLSHPVTDQNSVMYKWGGGELCCHYWWWW